MGNWNDATTWAPWLLLLMGVASTYVWRALGAGIGARIDPESRLLKWLTCVAYGLLAGLISRIMIYPVGILEQTFLAERIGAILFGFVIFFIFKRSIGAGTLSATGALLIIISARDAGFF